MRTPQIGLGTWDLRGDECVKIVKRALELGYKHIDTAYFYNNHAAIGKAIQGVDRETIYITSKLAIQEQVDPNNIELTVQKACHSALSDLKTDYLDLYLIHNPNRSYPLNAIFEAMLNLIQQKKVRAVGVSNYTIHHLQDLLQSHNHPFANQVEFHPYLNQQALLDYCQKHDIELISYRPFGKGKLLHEVAFETLAATYNKSPAQIILRWLLQKGIPSIPKASSEQHLKDNITIFDFSLSENDMLTLDNLNQNKRFCRPDDPEHTY